MFFSKNMYAHPPVYALLRMLQAEYMKKLLKGDFFCQILDILQHAPLHPLLNKFQDRSCRQIREGLRFKKFKNPDVLPDGFL